MTKHETRIVTTADGRELEVLAAGPPDGFPLVFYHGTPGAAVPFVPLERAAAARDLRVISYSRPGYGRSTPRADAPTTAMVADEAADTATILDDLGLGQFVTLAWSGGGPRGFSCAAMLPDRCRAVATLASPVPPDAVGLAQVAGMRPENAALHAAIGQGKEAFTAVLEQQVAPLRSATDDQLLEWFRGTLAPVDNAALQGEFADYMTACIRHSMHQGVVGWRDDLFTYTRPWGFGLDRISLPVAVWHGTGDINLGSVHGVWFSEHVPGVRSHIIEGEGHISLFRSIDQVLDELLEHTQVNPWAVRP
jgi:pimeloyl-ACP methyl ester carboxylesterase